MGETFVALAGTPAGENLALILALVSAIAHAIFGAICKGGRDPFLNRGAINISYSLMAAPLALFVFPLPEGIVILALAASFVVHVAYEWFQAAAFTRGAFTVVYPVARGTGPAITGVFAVMLFGERLEPWQWFGLLLLSSAIISLGVVNFMETDIGGKARKGLRLALIFAFCTGINTALYTTIDAFGIRHAVDPFTYVFWVFFLGGFGFPVVAIIRWHGLETKPALPPLVVRGIIGGIVGMFSFGSLMLATRIGKVAEAAAVRETSIIFAMIIGVFLFQEKVDLKRFLIILLIALGAVMIEFH